ncbi:hypothetical protein BH18ACT4_BH18ACT4_11540 [soil metagenome]
MIARLGLTAFLAEVLAYSAVSKLHRPATFFSAIRDYSALRNVPEAVLRLFVVVIPTIEVALVALLAISATRPLGAVLTIMLLVTFYVLIARDTRPAFSNCGCGGSPVVEAPKYAFLVRNLVLVLAAAVLCLWELAVSSTGDLSTVTVVATCLMVLPFVALTLQIPAILHIWHVDRRNMPAKLEVVRSSMQSMERQPSPVEARVGQ